jgi:uncharacterized membrane protein
VSAFEPALFVHLLGFAVLAGGIAVATAALAAARRRERPHEIALLLGVTQTGVALVAVGALVVLVSGFWLLDITGHGLDEGWASGALGLLAVSIALGALGGQAPKRARLEAEQAARENRPAGPELERRLHDRRADVMNAVAAAALIAALALMVWRPGD